MLNLDGHENGISSLMIVIPHSIRNVFLGNRLIARARMTVITMIMTAPATLIWSKFIFITSLQIVDDLFQLCNLLRGKLLSAEKSGK